MIRAEDLFTHVPVVFVGQFAAGPAVRTDTVNGSPVVQHLEVLLDAGTASTGGTHRLSWAIIAGVPTSWSGSTGWQIDGTGFSEVFVAC